MKLKRRFICLLLCAVMLLCFSATAAFAAQSETDGEENAQKALMTAEELSYNSLAVRVIVEIISSKTTVELNKDNGNIRMLWKLAFNIIDKGIYDESFPDFAKIKQRLLSEECYYKRLLSEYKSEHKAVLLSKLDSYFADGITPTQRLEICNYIENYISYHSSTIDKTDSDISLYIDLVKQYRDSLKENETVYSLSSLDIENRFKSATEALENAKGAMNVKDAYLQALACYEIQDPSFYLSDATDSFRRLSINAEKTVYGTALFKECATLLTEAEEDNELRYALLCACHANLENLDSNDTEAKAAADTYNANAASYNDKINSKNDDIMITNRLAGIIGSCAISDIHKKDAIAAQ